jgi:hypothetical protein
MWREAEIFDVLRLSHIGSPATKNVVKIAAPVEYHRRRRSNQMMFERRGSSLPRRQPPDTASVLPMFCLPSVDNMVN